MSGALTAVLIVATVFFSMVSIVKIISDNMMRRKILEKGMLDENIKYLYAQTSQQQVPASLKWGMVLIAVGAAIFIGQFFPHTFSEEATIGVMFLMAGLALILYYFIARRILKQSEEAETRK